MSVPSLEFLLAFLALVVVFHLLPPSARWRQGLLAACNVAFVALALPNYWSWLAVGVFALSGYAAARVLQRKPSAVILTLYLCVLVAVFMVLKKYVLAALVLPAWVMAHPIGTVGLSYMLFRQIHFVVDAMQQQIPEFSLWTYANYQFNLFAFMSGPIQRYQDFDGPWRHMQPLLTTRHDILRAWLRLFIGALKIALVSAWVWKGFEWQRGWFLREGALAGASRVHVLARFAIVFYGYLVFLYFNFSGYCDVVIAAAALVGIKLPENFDRPYLARNVADYWTRFHQSLGFWIRDYLFTPLYKTAATRWTSAAPLLVFPCYLIAFVLAGLWHGNSLNFLVFGLLHGCGVGAGKVWENYLIRRRGRKGLKAYLASWPIRVGAIVLTLHFVSFTMLFFANDIGDALEVLRHFAHGMTS